MLKKVVVSGLIAIIIGAVGIGIYDAWQSRGTDGPVPRVEAARGDGGQRARFEDGDVLAQGSSQGQRGRQNEAGPDGLTNGVEMAQRGTQGYRGGQGAAEPLGLADGSEMPQPQVEVDEWLTVTGTVTSVDQTGLAVTTDDGQTLTLELGPPWFWSSQDVDLQVGDVVEVLGFEADEGDGLVFQAATITRLSDDATLKLRDLDGRPLWAGRGQAGR
jgi:hypothetical protein